MARKRITARDKVLSALEKADRPLRVTEISKVSGVNYNTVRGVLYRLMKEGLITRYLGGYLLREKKR
ncbi:MAG: helix-turn-helix domain-containing protein [Desulfurococcales archaeon]|nr:helix-turn-helix domain-containing protein [Desulfurococcales archaeon]